MIRTTVTGRLLQLEDDRDERRESVRVGEVTFGIDKFEGEVQKGQVRNMSVDRSLP